jgi:hypothetical protein
MFHQFLDAQSRQAMDRIAEEKHLPVADFAAKMAGHLDELETGLQKAFDRLPSDGGAGEKVVSMRQLLARESQHGSLAVVSSSKKAPSSPSSHAAAAAGSVTTEEAGTSGGTKSSSKKKKKKPSAGPAKKSGDGGPSGS